jgi:hypothetical protein
MSGSALHGTGSRCTSSSSVLLALLVGLLDDEDMAVFIICSISCFQAFLHVFFACSSL